MKRYEPKDQAELDRWIQNCLIVFAGVLWTIPRDCLDTARPKNMSQYPECFGWWVYEALKGTYKGTPNPLTFRAGILGAVGVSQVDHFLFGFEIFNPDGSLLNVDWDFIENDLRNTFEDQLFRLLRHQKKLDLEAKEKEERQIFVCPDCESSEVTTEHHQMFMVNTGEHYCHSMKTQDYDSPATCLTCGWNGERHQLISKVAEDPTDAKRKTKELKIGKPKVQDPSGQ